MADNRISGMEEPSLQADPEEDSRPGYTGPDDDISIYFLSQVKEGGLI